MKRKLKFILKALLVCMPFVLLSCELESDFDKQVDKDERVIMDYLKQNNEEATKDNSGIFYKAITTNPTGKPVSIGDILRIRYKVNAIGGGLVDEVKESDEPVKFGHISNGIVPAGINYGITRMKTGEKYRFYIPSYLAYQGYSSKYFSSYSSFVAEIELVEIVSEVAQEQMEKDSINAYILAHNLDSIIERSSGLRFKSIEEGTGPTPITGDLVTLHFTRKYLNDSIIASTVGHDPSSFYLGSNNAVPGLEEGLKMMKKGSKALLIMPSSIAFRSGTLIIPEKLSNSLLEQRLINSNVKPYSPLVYEVELL